MNCERCGQSFEITRTSGRPRRFCSERCRKKAEKRRNSSFKKHRMTHIPMKGVLLPRDGICGVCEKGVVSANRKACSEECSAWRDRCRRAGYVLSKIQYEEMLKASAGYCDGCGQAGAALQIDHCHETGAIRGLLCNNCNSCLAHARDSRERLLKLAEYLNREKGQGGTSESSE